MAAAATMAILRTLFPPNPKGSHHRADEEAGVRRPARHRASEIVERAMAASEIDGRNGREPSRAPEGFHAGIVYSGNLPAVMTPGLVQALSTDAHVFCRRAPARRVRELLGHEAWTAWIDTYHAVKRLTHEGTYVFLTDSAVGTPEEDNIGTWWPTSAGRAAQRVGAVPDVEAPARLLPVVRRPRVASKQIPALVVLGGDRTIGPPRCVEHAWQLRSAIRSRQPEAAAGRLGRNPHADAGPPGGAAGRARVHRRVSFLTQIVSHHHAAGVERFVKELERREVRRARACSECSSTGAPSRRQWRCSRSSCRSRVEALTREFAGGATLSMSGARTVRTLLDAGARHFYISNLPLERTSETLAQILTNNSRTLVDQKTEGKKTEGLTDDCSEWARVPARGGPPLLLVTSCWPGVCFFCLLVFLFLSSVF